MSSTTATTYTTDEGIVPIVPSEWLEYFYHEQHFMDDLEAPFIGGTGTGTTEAGVSDYTSGGGRRGYVAAASLEENGCGEIMFSGTATSSAVTNTSSADRVISPHNSTGANNNNQVDLSPKAAIAKQVKRRSRASRRTPVTLLNASIKNFRTVVQQYTGCRGSNPGFNRNGKGPITLSFGGPNHRNNFP